MIETGLYTHLREMTPLTDLVAVGTQRGIYPGIAPQEVVAPYVVFFVISDNEYYDLGGDIGLSQVVIQIECWSDTYLKSKELSEVLRKHISGFAGYFGTVKIQKCHRESIYDRIEHEAEAQGDARYCVVCDYLIIYEKERAYL